MQGSFRAFQKVAPQTLGNTEADLLDLLTTGSERWHVWFYLCNEDSSSHTVTIGIDNASGGTLAAGEYILKDYTIAANAYLDWLGPFYMDRDDQIRGFADTASKVAIHMRLEQIW